MSGKESAGCRVQAGTDHAERLSPARHATRAARMAVLNFMVLLAEGRGRWSETWSSELGAGSAGVGQSDGCKEGE